MKHKLLIEVHQDLFIAWHKSKISLTLSWLVSTKRLSYLNKPTTGSVFHKRSSFNKNSCIELSLKTLKNTNPDRWSLIWLIFFILFFFLNPNNLARVYLSKVNNGNTRIMCEICLKFTLKKKCHQWTNKCQLGNKRSKSPMK